MQNIIFTYNMKNLETLEITQEHKKRFHSKDAIPKFINDMKNQGFQVWEYRCYKWDNSFLVVASEEALSGRLGYISQQELLPRGYRYITTHREGLYKQVIECVDMEDKENYRHVFIPYYQYEDLEQEFNNKEDAFKHIQQWEVENTDSNGFLLDYGIDYIQFSKFETMVHKLESKKYGILED